MLNPSRIIYKHKNDKSNKRILVVAPHTDDGEFGCGGSIARFIEESTEVYYLALSTAVESVPPGMPPNTLEIEVREATKVLGIPKENLIVCKYPVRKLNYHRQDILEELIKIRLEIRPTMIFTPAPGDLHQDHATVTQEVIRAFKEFTVFGYELPWNNITFSTQAFIRLSRKHVGFKVSALHVYKSQSGRPYAEPSFIKSLAQTRGVQIGTEYAETFEIIRSVI